MFRTEVVASKNIRKSVFYKVFNGVAIVVFLSIVLLMSNVFGPESSMQKFINSHYNDVIRPVILGLALAIFVTSMLVRNAMKSPKRLGSLEMDENEVRYLVEDELQETVLLKDVQSIEFEYYSFRMRGNPMGCMNYLTLKNLHGEKTYEIVIANTMVKATFGALLQKINQKIPVKVTYAYFLKRILKDSDFKF
jgi:multidrug transporter EmrE-like cation transporter